MPQALTTDDGMTFITSKLDGDTLTVHPITFVRMQEVLARPEGTETERASKALAVAGLDSDEITSRTLRETRVIVDERIQYRIKE